LFEDIREATRSAMLNIFETMFFVFLEPWAEDSLFHQEGTEPSPNSEEPTGSIPLEFLKSEIHFQGKHSGFLRLFLPYDLGELLTVNFMGFEEEVTEFQILDLVGELTNMICGNMFSVLDKSSVYHLGSPVTRKISFRDGIKSLVPMDLTINFLAEGRPVTVQLQLQQVP
jgi:hypothetical protein